MCAASHNWYDVLSVKSDASGEEIHSAYRELVKRYHPDKFYGDRSSVPHDRMTAINEAYTVLSDPVRRRRYDRDLERQKRQLDQQPARFKFFDAIGRALNKMPWWLWLSLWFLIAPRLLRLLMVTTVGQFVLAAATIFVFWRMMPKRPVDSNE